MTSCDCLCCLKLVVTSYQGIKPVTDLTTPNEWPINCFDENSADKEPDFEQDPYIDLNSEDLLKEFDNQKLCKSELNRLRDAGEIRSVLQRTGWLDETLHINLETNINEVNSAIHHDLPPAKWKAMLQEKKQSILDHKAKPSSKAEDAAHESITPNVVKVIDKAYLDKRYHTTEHNDFMDTVAQKYNLNEEQDRAFRIIANHVVLPNSEPLKMYIGGMGGTGKSQVLKAISSFFESRNEAYRFIIVAPTGTAAALLSGSTYHSVFGINDMSGEAQSTKALIQVRTRLLGVDYIFMDKVSMLICIKYLRSCAR
jgi:hypothetical protein